MCGKSYSEIKGLKTKMYLGYHGGCLEIGDFEYYTENYHESNGVDRLSDCLALMKHLNTYSKQEVIKMILDLVDNGEED